MQGQFLFFAHILPNRKNLGANPDPEILGKQKIQLLMEHNKLQFLKGSEPPPRDLERELMYAVRDLRSGRTTPAIKGGSKSQRIDGESNR